MPITQQQKEQLVDILKSIDGVEIAKITGALYDTFASAEMTLSWDRHMALANRMFFAHQPWSRLPLEFNDIKMALFRSVEEKLLVVFPELFNLVQAEEAQPQPPAEASPPPASTGQQQIPLPVATSGGGLTITTTMASPEITPTTRSQIDDLDQEASMHGMDTESPPEGGAQPEQQIVVSAEDESAEIEEDGSPADDGDDDDVPEITTAPESNGHNSDAPAAPEETTAPDAPTASTP
jgi:hypothetical protein